MKLYVLSAIMTQNKNVPGAARDKTTSTSLAVTHRIRIRIDDLTHECSDALQEDDQRNVLMCKLRHLIVIKNATFACGV